MKSFLIISTIAAFITASVGIAGAQVDSVNPVVEATIEPVATPQTPQPAQTPATPATPKPPATPKSPATPRPPATPKAPATPKPVIIRTPQPVKIQTPKPVFPSPVVAA